jgi:hypothetical protein
MGDERGKRGGPERARLQRLDAALTSFILAQRDDNGAGRNLEALKWYLETEGLLKVDLEKLGSLVDGVRSRMEQQKHRAAVKARLFTKEDRPREARYRYGSDFCANPGCGMFKNYEKECPYCGHVEWKMG